MITYKVKHGDTLSALAKTFLGKANRYPEIKALNGLKDATIYVGQTLKIPVSDPSEHSETKNDETGNLLRKALNDILELDSVKKLLNKVG